MSTEPWLRGIEPGIDPVIGHLLRASQQVREDMTLILTPIDRSYLWKTQGRVTPVGFHAKHLAGSTDRLCTYLVGLQLAEAQLIGMKREKEEGSESAAELLAAIGKSLDRYESLLRGLKPAEFGSVREIGRQKLQVTVISLAIHIAEHAQQHAGQAITAAQCAASD